MKNLITLSLILAAVFCGCTSNTQSIAFDEGTLNLTALQEDAVRIRYTDGTQLTMPEMVYEQTEAKISLKKTFTA